MVSMGTMALDNLIHHICQATLVWPRNHVCYSYKTIKTQMLGCWSTFYYMVHTTVISNESSSRRLAIWFRFKWQIRVQCKANTLLDWLVWIQLTWLSYLHKCLIVHSGVYFSSDYYHIHVATQEVLFLGNTAQCKRRESINMVNRDIMSEH